jgi:hypothetical protein
VFPVCCNKGVFTIICQATHGLCLKRPRRPRGFALLRNVGEGGLRSKLGRGAQRLHQGGNIYNCVFIGCQSSAISSGSG